MNHLLTKQIILVAALNGFLSSGASAQNPDPSSPAALDQLLDSVPAGQEQVVVDDAVYEVAALRAWRNRFVAMQNAGDDPDGPQPLLTNSPFNKWPDGIVYYTFNANVTAVNRQHFRDAAAEWATYANLQFIPRTFEPDYVEVRENATLQGGLSNVGMVGGMQFIQVGPGYWSRYTLLHEIGHTLGMQHEHMRPDRNTYVTVLSANYPPSQSGNFVIIPGLTHGTAYDFRSVMHYSRNSFSNDPETLNTIEPKPAYAEFLNVMGDFRSHLSTGDRAGVALLYGSGPVLSFVVTNTKDSGPGSLRQCLSYAMDNPGATVTFNIPQSDPGFDGTTWTIRPTGTLPALQSSMVIDASTQPGNTNPNGPEIVINGLDVSANMSDWRDGFTLTGSDVTLRGFVIQRFEWMGIRIQDANTTNNTIEGCCIGTDATGTAAEANGIAGIAIENGAHHNTIGGTTTAARNVISGNGGHGIAIYGTGTSANTVVGNFIGTSVAGAAALPNAGAGVAVFSGTHNNVIGGTAVGARNVISGNAGQGVLITHAGTEGNLVQGNLIGTDASGGGAVANSSAGLSISGGAQTNVVGGTEAGARNVISGNLNQGVVITGVGTSGNVVEGNFVGLNNAGSAAVGNAWSGIAVTGAATGNAIGGTSAASRNVISGNLNYGVLVNAAGTSGNVVRGNFIGTDPAGTAAIGNSWAGVGIAGGAQSNAIGGTEAGARNVISGNLDQGISISGAGTSMNVVAGNFIGLNASGTTALANASAGLVIYAAASSNSIGGTEVGARNVISGNAFQGIAISGAGTTSNVVAGNFIGLNDTGTAAVGNAWSGIAVFGAATNNKIGGADAGARNVISGNLNQGVVLSGVGTSGNVVEGNFIGLNGAGSAAIGNAWSGIGITAAATNNTIGGTAPGVRNIISGNLNHGILINTASTSGNRVQGNFIGTNPVGAAAIPNSFSGVAFLTGATGNLLGGAAPGAGNVISGNINNGVVVRDSGTDANRVEANIIGLNSTATASVPNGVDGVRIFAAAKNNIVGGTTPGTGNTISGNTNFGVNIVDATTTGNLVQGNAIGLNAAGGAAGNGWSGVGISNAAGNHVGGTAPGAGNVIANNQQAGVVLYSGATNRIQGNSIHRNDRAGVNWQGIDIGGNGKTNNDADDPDTGPNLTQNYPVITAAQLTTTGSPVAAVTQVSGTLDSTPGTAFRIEFFASPTAATLGFGEGQYFLGALSGLATNASGDAAFTGHILSTPVPAGWRITATATDPAGNTSEFSNAFIVTTVTDTDGDGMPDAFESAHGLSTTVNDAGLDADGDSQSNIAEMRLGTDPDGYDPGFSLGVARDGADIRLQFPTIAGKLYRLRATDNLGPGAVWQTLLKLWLGDGTNSILTDPQAATLPRRFYQLEALP